MNQVRSYSRRLKLPGAVTEQAEEYHRLAEVKCSSSLRTEPSLTLVCIDLACVKLGEPVNKKQLQCLSGQQPRGYLSTYQLVEKLLNVAGQVGVKELAMRFGNFEGEALADEILKRYRERIDGKYTAAQKEALDLTKPLYPAAALYCACKLLKIHCNKSKYQGASQSTRAMFLNVLEEINQCAPKDIDAFKQGKKSKAITISKVKDTETAIDMPVDHNSKPSVTKHIGRESFHSRIQSDPTDDTYLKWKDAILREAKKQLTDQTLNS